MNLAEMLQHDFLSLVPIPKQIPVSTLVCAPAHAFIKQFALPAGNPNTLAAKTPSPCKVGNKMLEKRMKEQMQSDPGHQLRSIKTQNQRETVDGYNNVSNDGFNKRGPSVMYSPLETNRMNSQCENGLIMASARDGTPIAAAKAAEDRAAIIEFDPICSTAKKCSDPL